MPDSEHALHEHIRAERVRFVFIQSALPIIFSPLAAAILSLALWNFVDRRTLVTWTAGLVSLAIVRIVLVRSFPPATPSETQVRRWERIFVASIVLVDVWLGFGVLLLLGPHPLAVHALVFSFVMLMAGGHTASYSAHPATVILGVLALSVPITVHFALQPDVFHRAMAFVAIMYLAASFRSIKTLGYFFGRAHRLAHELEKLAKLDFLTSLSNRRAFYESGEAALRERPATLLMLDIDHFKTINDRFGHAAGDEVLRATAAIIRDNIRDTGVAGRLGGEEFAVLLPATPLDDALATAERLRRAVEAFAVDGIRFTISVGVAEAEGEETLESLMARADAALYTAKNEGRNRVAA